MKYGFFISDISALRHDVSLSRLTRKLSLGAMHFEALCGVGEKNVVSLPCFAFGVTEPADEKDKRLEQ